MGVRWWLAWAILAQATPDSQTWCLILPWGTMWPPSTVTDIDGVLGFYSVPPPLWVAFCAAAGDPGQDLRLLASLPPYVVEQSLLAARLTSGRRLTPMEATHVGMVYRASHRLVYLAAGGQEGGWLDPDPWSSSGAMGPTSLGAPVGQGGMLTSPERKMKLSQVADQGDESEFLVEAEANKGRYYSTYMAKVGG